MVPPTRYFSPDGDWIGFQTQNFLKKVSPLGGPVVTLSSLAGGFRGASWGSDDTIVFATVGGMFRVPAAGGKAIALLPSDETVQVLRGWPEILPGGRAMLGSLFSGDATNRVMFLLNLETLEEQQLIPGTSPRYSPTGHIVYSTDDTLLAVPFDLDRLELTGNSVPVVEGVITKPTGVANFDLASDGSLVYVGSSGGGQEVVWLGGSP